MDVLYSLKANALNLQNFSKITVLKSIWDRLILEKLFNWHYNYGKTLEKVEDCTILDDVINDSLQLIKSWNLPVSLCEELSFASAVMGYKSVLWINAFFDDFKVWFNGEIFWTRFGDIDKEKTFQAFYWKDPNVILQYCKQEKVRGQICNLTTLPCLCADENFIKKYLKDMKKLSKDFVMPDHIELPDAIDSVDDDYCVYLIIIKGILEHFKRHTSFYFAEGTEKLNDKMCQLCFFFGYFKACKYFWCKLDFKRQIEILPVLFGRVDRFCYYEYLLVYISEYFNICNIGDVLFYLNMWPEDIKRAFIIENICEIPIFRLYSLPFQDLFSVTLNTQFGIANWADALAHFLGPNKWNNIFSKYCFKNLKNFWFMLSQEDKKKWAGEVVYNLHQIGFKYWPSFSYFDFIFNDIDLKHERTSLCKGVVRELVTYLAEIYFCKKEGYDVLDAKNVYLNVFISAEEHALFNPLLIESLDLYVLRDHRTEFETFCEWVFKQLEIKEFSNESVSPSS